MPKSRRALARRVLLKTVSGLLTGAVFALEVVTDLTPGVRMTTRRRLPNNMGAGILGAEVATWWAISPSLLPRPWWITAANVAICQGVGHVTAAGAAWGLGKLTAAAGRRPPTHLTTPSLSTTHVTLAAVTAVAAVLSLRRQGQQADLIGARNRRGPRHALVGTAVGTVGYGALLLLGEAAQQGVDRMSRRLGYFLPPWLSWPLAAATVGALAGVASDRVLLRRFLARAARQAELVNRAVFPGTSMPWEPERSGSPWSLEAWTAVGSQGRALLSGGPRARNIAEVTGLDFAREPIRIFIGRVPGRTLRQAVDLTLAEMDRTGAFHRDTLVIQTSAGTGWIADWSMEAVEFLTGGNCATMALQYSYLPSAFSYFDDRELPATAARMLITAVLERLERLPEDNRPKIYVAGESLGAYGTAAAFEDLDDLLNRVDGAVLSGAPRFTRLIADLTRRREDGSPERLPIVDGGRHVRFVAHPAHLRRDFTGRPYRRAWDHPRVIIAQHASDPVVWFHSRLFWRRPDWLTEPGSRGIPAPPGQHLDVFPGMRWVPFITAWQVGLDQLTSTTSPSGHGHNYHAEMLYYWAAVLGEGVRVELTTDVVARAERWIRTHSVRR
ncbi:alpha/beta-hydrolase family protein [Corynebacterium halotolerans]|uniref:Alpha/beta-hydrolase catalytic domain-containing protein n=1 Tax=Corynebacterium halotolerans YIM 70093 = DSM 44683 TaxID=1121362 RepID=M1N145_9CORY|nr:alpha/beta-hydrolase family protein [Corynebacterium halotolerans]AGF73649.1 hypothetical protein A605_13265 [Corynebacterium halotolerans YIM 70093 = DSM 44683]